MSPICRVPKPEARCYRSFLYNGASSLAFLCQSNRVIRLASKIIYYLLFLFLFFLFLGVEYIGRSKTCLEHLHEVECRVQRLHP